MHTLAWLDHSDHERARALDLVAMLREREARDELGIGAIRDTISDLLFPGTSTLQTRARYFLFIPRIYSRLESTKLTSQQLQERGRKAELALCERLLEGGESDGVIGRVARRTLKRLPSSLYWNGLGAWGLRAPLATQRDYFRRATSASRTRELVPDGDALEWPTSHLWEPRLPLGDDDGTSATTFALTHDEATYLADKIRTRHPNTLLAYLLDQQRPALGSDSPWEWAGSTNLPDPRAYELHHARMFSELLHGAQLLYNYILAGEAKSDEMQELYQRWLDDFGKRFRGLSESFGKWRTTDFWALIHKHRNGTPISEGARRFVDSWVHHLREHGVEGIAEHAAARELVIKRERALKGRFARTTGGRPLELWRGQSGADALNFRWRQVTRVFNDIRQGLGYAHA